MREKQNPALVASSKPGNIELLNIIKSTPPGEVWKCPCCEQALPFQNLEWLDELEMLLAKYGGELGIDSNLTGFSLPEQWRDYKFLKRIKVNKSVSGTHGNG